MSYCPTPIITFPNCEYCKSPPTSGDSCKNCGAPVARRIISKNINQELDRVALESLPQKFKIFKDLIER